MPPCLVAEVELTTCVRIDGSLSQCGTRRRSTPRCSEVQKSRLSSASRLMPLPVMMSTWRWPPPGSGRGSAGARHVRRSDACREDRASHRSRAGRVRCAGRLWGDGLGGGGSTGLFLTVPFGFTTGIARGAPGPGRALDWLGRNWCGGAFGRGIVRRGTPPPPRQRLVVARNLGPQFQLLLRGEPPASAAFHILLRRPCCLAPWPQYNEFATVPDTPRETGGIGRPFPRKYRRVAVRLSPSPCPGRCSSRRSGADLKSSSGATTHIGVPGGW